MVIYHGRIRKKSPNKTYPRYIVQAKRLLVVHFEIRMIPSVTVTASLPLKYEAVSDRKSVV